MQESDAELILHLDEAKKLVQELSDRKKELKASMFNYKHASFTAFLDMGEASLGELTFTDMQLPFKKLDFSSTELKPVDIRAKYDFLLPLENGQRIVAFKWFLKREDVAKCFTQMSCFDRHGRLIEMKNIRRHVQQENVVQSGPSEFIVSKYTFTSLLCVYNSDLECLHHVRAPDYSHICCNSKFVFGLWDTSKKCEEKDPLGRKLAPHSDGEDDVDDNQQEKQSRRRIQVRHLDTLSRAFGLRVPEKYKIERIMSDEHHLVAMSRMDSESRQWFVSIFNLAYCDKDSCASVDGVKTAARFFLAERHFDLDMNMRNLWLEEVFLLDGWLVVPGDHEIFWFDKKGTRNEMSTEFDSDDLRSIYSSHSVILFAFHEGQLLMKR